MEKGLPIRNITIDPMGRELRRRTAEYLKSIGCDARFFADDALVEAANGSMRTSINKNIKED